MSCYHPFIGIPTGELTVNGKKKYLIKSSKLAADQLIELKDKENILIPCGKCLGCRLDYSRKWADRMMLELETEKKGIFLTLTYDDDHIPFSETDDGKLSYTLEKRDCQLFIKRLRKYYSDIRIRFFLAGEYGSQTFRPHYHCILFGICIDDVGDCVIHGMNELNQPYYVSDKIAKIWKNGFVLLSDVSWATCAYVARYVVKKATGVDKDIYLSIGKRPEFVLMSRRPGIGAKYFEEHKDCIDLSNINLSTPDGGLKISIPKYYLKKIQLSDPCRYDSIMEDRKRFASDAMLLKLQKNDNLYLDYLEVEEMNKIAETKALKRNKVR